MTNRTRFTLIAFLSLTLTGCSFAFDFGGSSAVSSASAASSAPASSNPVSSPAATSMSMADSGDGYYRLVQPNQTVTLHDLGAHNGNAYLESQGTQKVLVLPIEFSSHPFSDSRIADIKTAIQGSAEETQYWESLKSFYKKSSYGKLDMEFVFADPCRIATSPSDWYTSLENQFVDPSDKSYGTFGDYPEAMPQEALKKAVTQFRNNGGDTKQFDQDGDGFIDACIMVYSCDDKSNDASLKKYKYGDLFWAYQYSDLSAPIEGNVASPIPNRYFWASYDFFYEDVAEGKGVDAHTIIHEMGHIFGADDYYNYGEEGELGQPSGGMMMMDFNIGDHDSFTKLLYGWVSPYCITGDCEITIRPFESSGDCILLADSWNGTAFDEYVLIELYTPTGLNARDAAKKYTNNSKLYETSGVRVFHVDNRYVYGQETDEYGVFVDEGFLSDDDLMYWKMASERLLGERQYVNQAVTNTEFYDCDSLQGKGFELLQIVQRGKTNTVKYGNPSTADDLFQTGDRFSMGEYYKFFPAAPKLNNGNALPFEIEFKEVNDSYATLSFRKTA